MKINRYNRCRSLSFAIRCFQVEFWFCPKGEVIPEHRHPQIDSYVLALAGSMRWKLGDRVRAVCGPLRVRSSGRLGIGGHRVRQGESHGATVVGRFGLFAVFQRWEGQPTSAAENIEYI